MKLAFPFDPIKRSAEIESLVMQDNRRLYYRFRSSGHYGGVVTADTVGCNILCAYCWNYRKNENPTQGEFCSPGEVISKLRSEAGRAGIQHFRVSGAEPILGERSTRHLAEVLRAFPGRFIVETNGIMLGYNPEFLGLLLRHHPGFSMRRLSSTQDDFVSEKLEITASRNLISFAVAAAVWISAWFLHPFPEGNPLLELIHLERPHAVRAPRGVHPGRTRSVHE